MKIELDRYKPADREKRIFIMRARGITYKEISKELNISPERARQIFFKALKKQEYKQKAIQNPFLLLSVRTQSALRSAGLFDLLFIFSRSDYELLSLKNFGKKCLKEVRALQREYR